MMCTLYHSRINHLAFSSSVREAKLFDAKHGLLDNLLEPKFCAMPGATLPNSSEKKRMYLRTNACKTQQKVLQPI